MKSRKMILPFIVLFVLCVGFNFYYTFPYYTMNSVKFQNLDNIRLSARYCESHNGQGVLIVPDISHDKSEYSSLVSELRKLGYGVYIFDYPSQGTSGGTVPFRLNVSAYLAEQFYCAMVSYSQLANMHETKIHVIGYGAGARAVLQTAALGFIRPASMTLIGCEINMTNKVQYDVLNFSVDTNLPWINALNQSVGGCPINLIYSGFDDVSTQGDNEAIASALNRPAGVSAQNSVSVTKINNVVHNALSGSVSAATAAVAHIAKQTGTPYQPDPALYFRAPAIAFAYILLIFGFLMTGFILSNKRTAQVRRIRTNFPKRFIRYKLLMWLPTAVVCCVLPIVLYLIPMTYPYYDIFTLMIFTCYGLSMLFMYKFTTFQDNMGLKFFSKITSGSNYKGGVITAAALIGALTLISLSGTYYLFSFQSKWLWIFLFTALCFAVFYVDEKERVICAGSFNQQIKILTVNYLGLLLAPVIFCILGQFSAACSMLIVISRLLIVLSMERLLHQIRCPVRVNALMKSFIFQLIVFAQAPMFFGQ